LPMLLIIGGLINEILKKVNEDDALEDTKIKTWIEMLSYLMVNSNREQRLEYFNVMVKLFECHHHAYSKKGLSLLYENMSIAEIEEILPQLFEVPVTTLYNEQPIELPELYTHTLGKIELSDKAVSNIIDGLHNENRKIVAIAYELAYYISLAKLSQEQKDKLRNTIAELRRQNPLTNTLYYEWFPYDENYDIDVDIDEVRNNTLKKFGNDDYVCSGPSDFIQRFNKNYAEIINIAYLLDPQCVEWIISKVIDVLKINKEPIFKELEDDYANIFFDMHNILDRTFSRTTRLLRIKEEEMKSLTKKDTLADLWDIIEQYEKKGIATIALKFQLSLILKNVKKEQIKELAFQDVLSNTTNIRNAAGNTIVSMADKGVSIQEALTAVTGRAGVSKGANYYLRLLSRLVKNEQIKITRCSDIANDLEDIYKSMKDDTISIMDKLDAMHGANILAGCCYANQKLMNIEKLSKAVNKWKEYSDDESNFNDIRFGFEQGINSCF